MNKEEFLNALRTELKELPDEEIEKSVEYYSEMIDDLIEDGASEEEAVGSLGSPKDTAEEILLNLPLKTLVKSKMKRNKAGHITLICASPVLAIGAVLTLVVYVVIWVLIAALFAVSAVLAVSGCVAAVGSMFIVAQNMFSGLFILGCSIASVGAGILLFLGTKKIAAFYVKFSKILVRKIKSFIIKEAE